MHRSLSAPKMNIVSIQEVEEPESPRPRAVHQFPANPAHDRTTRVENDFSTTGTSWLLGIIDQVRF